MKYVRTKEGIFENEFIKIRVLKDGSATMEYKGKFYEPPLNVKQANTIEELCDAFVFEDTDKTKWVLKNCKTAKTLNNGALFGAIWTDKGLIYVAKMNDKGELELL